MFKFALLKIMTPHNFRYVIPKKKVNHQKMPPKKGGGRKPGKGKAGPKGMSKPIAPGLVVSDLVKKEWKLGPVIGQGGFGYIYLGNTFFYYLFCFRALFCLSSRYIHSFLTGYYLASVTF